MAVPKKKTSVSRKGLRRAGQHHKLYRKHPVVDKTTGMHVLPHKIVDGFYKGKRVIAEKVTEESEDEQTQE